MVTGGWVKAFPGVPSGQVHFKDPPFRIAVPSHFPTTDIYFPTLEIPPAASVASVFITLRWQDYLINPVVFRHTCGPHTSLTIDSVSVVYTSGHPSLLLFFFFLTVAWPLEPLRCSSPLSFTLFIWPLTLPVIVPKWFHLLKWQLLSSPQLQFDAVCDLSKHNFYLIILCSMKKGASLSVGS